MCTRANTTTSYQLLRLGIILMLEAGLLPVLLRLGSLPFLATPGRHLGGWGAWLAVTPPADAVAAVARLVALGLAGWLLASTGVYLAARLARLPGLVRAAGRALPGPLRRLLDAALAVAVTATVTATVGAGSAALAAGPPAPPAPRVALVTPTASPTAAGAPAGPPARRLLQPTAHPAAPHPAPAPPAPVPDTHVVLDGESLWSIAAATVASAQPGGSPPPGDEQVARYWVEVVARNRPHLRSGNPNLIFPGEPVTLPPLP